MFISPSVNHLCINSDLGWVCRVFSRDGSWNQCRSDAALCQYFSLLDRDSSKSTEYFLKRPTASLRVLKNEQSRKAVGFCRHASTRRDVCRMLFLIAIMFGRSSWSCAKRKQLGMVTFLCKLTHLQPRCRQRKDLAAKEDSLYLYISLHRTQQYRCKLYVRILRRVEGKGKVKLALSTHGETQISHWEAS